MSIKNYTLRNIIGHLKNKEKRKYFFIEFKLEFRRLKRTILNSGIGQHISKMYLLFIALALIIPLFTINPSAKIDNRLSQIAQEYEIKDEFTINFAEPMAITPSFEKIKDTENYQKYTLKENENIDSLVARFSNIKKESITYSNPGKKIESGKEIVIPKENGLLIGYNKQASSKELSDGLNKTLGEVKEILKNTPEGYFFVKGDKPADLKKEYDKRLSRSRYNIDSQVRVNITPQYSITESEAIPNQDFSNPMNNFIAQYQGRRHHDGNGWANGECVSLVKRWQQFIGAAYGIWPGYSGYPRNAWAGYRYGNRGMAPENQTFGVMVVSDVNSLKPGDVVVINTPTSHTGIATGKYYDGSYEVFDQNSPVGSGARFTSYSKSSFIAALRYYKK